MTEAWVALGVGVLGVVSTLALAGRRERADGFESALRMLTSEQERLQALGRARVMQLCARGERQPERSRWDPRRWWGALRGRHRSYDGRRREEARALLIADLHYAVAGDVREQLAAPGDARPILIGPAPTVSADSIVVTWAIVETATAIGQLEGGDDAVEDLVVRRILEADLQTGAEPVDNAAPEHEQSSVDADADAALDADERLILIKLTGDARTLDDDQLKERTRRAWRLSISRVRDHQPRAVVAVVDGRSRGAWDFQGAHPDVIDGRLAFELGAPRPDLVGYAVHHPGQNPVRYWSPDSVSR